MTVTDAEIERLGAAIEGYWRWRDDMLELKERRKYARRRKKKKKVEVKR